MTLPFFLITLCGVSYLLSQALHAPEFGLWANLAVMALDYAKTNSWAGIVLGVCVVAAPVLVWVAYREHEVRMSRAIGEWAIAAVLSGVILYLRTNWPDNLSNTEARFWVFNLLLFAAWNRAVAGMLTAYALAGFRRMKRPRRTPPPWQEPHGRDARTSTEPETI